MKNLVGLSIIVALLLSSCTAITGDVSHAPASLVAVALIVIMKLVNDRVRLLSWPMEFLLAAAVTMIVVNLTRLYFLPMPF